MEYTLVKIGINVDNKRAGLDFFLNTDDLELEEENHRLGKNAKEKGKKMDTVF